jgi:hypothetical protein
MREALTDQDDDEQPTWSTPAVTITQPRPDPAPRVATEQATDALAPKSESDVVLAKLKEAGLPFIDSTDPVGECTLSTGERVTLRELNGEDETRCEAFLDHYGVKSDGAGQSTSLRFMALMSIDTINGEQRAPVDRLEFLRLYLNRFKRADIARIIAAYIRYSLTVDGSTFRPQG